MRTFLLLFFFFFYLNCDAHTARLKVSASIHDKSLPTVGIVITGGTIVQKTDARGSSVSVSGGGQDLIKTLPQLKNIANIKLVEFSNVDSAFMTPRIWADLSITVDQLLEEHPELKGVVVVHGTDTLSEAAYFLDITLKTKKPVVFIGAMRNASDPFTDGPGNLLNGIFQVCSNRSQDWGVTVTMNQYINSARDVEKTQTTNVQAFTSGEKGYLGYIYEGMVHRLNERLYRQRLTLPERLADVFLFTDYAGADGFSIRMAADKGYKGIVVEALGSGNVNEPVADALKYAISKGLVVIISTRVYQGSVYPAYGHKGGGKTLKEMGAIVTGNLRTPKAGLLLMVALPTYGKDLKKIEGLFNNPS